MEAIVEAGQFRQVLGQYPTGVVVVTAMSKEREALGMTVGSFTSVSLTPPLVAFLPDQSSSSWRALRESGTQFCVNFLAAHQEDVCRAVASRKTDKFRDIAWRPSAAGNPVIEGAVAFVDCSVETIHDAGDHHIVVGRVEELDVLGSGYPLLFFRGGYGSFQPSSLAAGDADLVEQLKMVDLVRLDLEHLADTFATEVTVVCLVNDELVLTASAGHTRSVEIPTRVGLRWPFLPPLGSVNVAWGSDELRERWNGSLPATTPDYERERVLRMPDLVRRRGYTITLGHDRSAALERAATQVRGSGPSPEPGELSTAFTDAMACYNPDTLDEGDFELRSVSAPVFNDRSEVVFTITLWGPRSRVEERVLADHTTELLACARLATRKIGGRFPSDG